MATFNFGTITAQGVGSSLDVANIVSELMLIEQAPLDRLVAQQETIEAKISALGSIKNILSSLQTSLSGFTSGNGLSASKAESSDAAIVSATGTSGAIAGNYAIEISQLAQSQKLVAAGQADTTTAIGNGTLTFDLGEISGGTFDTETGQYTGASFTSNGAGTFDIVIDSSNNTLAGIRDAINNADIGVTATIVNDGDPTNPQRLVLSSAEGGVDQSISISVAGDAALSDLLGHDPAGVQNLSETVTGQNAIFEVDGISITKSSNTVTDVIAGVTLNLNGITSGTPVTVSVSQDTDSAKATVEAFVNAYNDLLAEINSQTDSGFSSGTAGALASDSVTRRILTSIRDELTSAPTGITGTYNNLSSIGVSFQQDGTLALDDEILSTAIQSGEDIAELFSSEDGYATRLDSVVTELLAFNGAIDTRTNAFEDRISLLEDRQLTLESRLDRTEARLRAQFTNLDVLISSLSVTSDFLTQQLDILNSQTTNS